MTQVSVVMPVYNEAEVIQRVVAGFVSDVLDRLDDAEIVLVDDRSTDATPGLLDELAERNPRIRVEHSPVNSGHGPSMCRAIELSRGRWVFHADSDGQFVSGDFWSVWERRHDGDLVLGVRAERHDPRHRLFLTRIVRLGVALLAGRRITDANVPFKLFGRELWDELDDAMPKPTLAPSILLAVGTAALGRRIVEVPVTHLARPHGSSTLRLWRLVRFSLAGLRQLVEFRMRLRRLIRVAPPPAVESSD